MMMLMISQELEPGKYVVIPYEKFSSIIGELMARPELMRHIGPIHNWTFEVRDEDEEVKEKCPGEDCLMCTGEACNLCGAGCWDPSVSDCDHGSAERHEGSRESDYLRAPHDAAMAFYDEYEAASKACDTVRAVWYLDRAVHFATAAARNVPFDREPTRSVLFRSAASMAFDAGRPGLAAELAREGLRGRPDDELRHELLEFVDHDTARGGDPPW